MVTVTFMHGYRVMNLRCVCIVKKRSEFDRAMYLF